ncbi:MAG: LysR family transcriptional regulator [Rhodobacterales bacterium]|jgi:DNA-binding transcriptional LysR family regulator|nr:LysR family transcriptional regulator [Rhodobacterales bacterium]MDX5391720.1 LysR family transcriptional regulator [Rhodobacterales bacterium]MDX5491420.1 LysR family transcriptional regulator [Rhodobacterales bacterium]
MRNLDITTLRSFVAVADLGGVTRAAGHLHLTQSAVSMQLKRLEDVLGLHLLDRSNRTVSLTAAGQQMLGYARRMVDMNDEVMARLTDQIFEGEIVLGVPTDIVLPAVPQVLQRFNVMYPRMKVQLITTVTRDLKVKYRRGECDIILTTEVSLDPGGETLTALPLRWVGAAGGNAWRQRPLRLVFGRHCIFRAGAIAALESAGIPWELAVETESDRTIEATVSADMGINTMIDGMHPRHLEQIDHGGTLPELTLQKINMYGMERARGEVLSQLGALLRQAYQSL